MLMGTGMGSTKKESARSAHKIFLQICWGAHTFWQEGHTTSLTLWRGLKNDLEYISNLRKSIY